MANWTEITEHNLPRIGDETINTTRFVMRVTWRSARWDAATWHKNRWTHFREIGTPGVMAMTPEQFEENMKAIGRDMGGDTEAAHARADDLMCKVLAELGYGKGVSVFEQMDKWYA